MPNWVGEKYGAEAQRMWEHVFDNCEEKGYSSNCYEYATGTVEDHYGGKAIRMHKKSDGYKSWQDSVSAGDWKQAAEEFLNDPVVVKVKSEFLDMLTILRDVASQLIDIDYTIINAGLDNDSDFKVTYSKINSALSDYISPALGMKERGELEGADPEFLNAIDQLFELRIRIDDLDRFQFELKKIQEATYDIEKILDQYRDVQSE